MATISGTLNQTGSFAQKAPSTSVLGLGTIATVTEGLKYAAGTGPLQVDVMHSVSLTLTAPYTVDLRSIPTGGIMERVRELIVIVADPAAGDDVLVSRAASNGWTFLPPAAHGIPVKAAGGIFRLSDPLSADTGVGLVTAAGNRAVTITPVGARALYVDLIILGCSIPYAF